MFIPDCYKNQNICNKVFDNYAHALESVSDFYKNKKCVIKLSVLILPQYNWFLIDLR